MREIISLHVGQAGVQMGTKCWELYCNEHGISPSGIQLSEESPESISNKETFFSHNDSGKYVPRSLFVDLEPSVVEEIQSGNQRELFNPDQLVVGKEDAANNFARGHYTVGKNLLPDCLEKIRRMAERCDGLQGFLSTAAIGGGTGSGTGSLLLEALSADFGKLSKLTFSLFPAPTLATAVVEPYNSVLALHALLEHSDVSIMIDNQALYNALEPSTSKTRKSSFRAGYNSLNQVVAQAASSLTTSLRFAGALNVDLGEFQTNLVPYPRIHFLMPALAPLLPTIVSAHSSMGVSELTTAVFEPRSTLCSSDFNDGRLMAASLMYRGDVIPREVNAAVAKLKVRESIRFVPWSPTGFKVGICKEPPYNSEDSTNKVKRSVALLANSTAVASPLDQIGQKFDSLWRKRAFVHWYVGEGMEEGEFTEAREDLETLKRDYKEIEEDGGEAEDELYRE